MNPTAAFQKVRETLFKHREDLDAAVREFSFPVAELSRFNWAIDWFDAYARGNTRPALRIISESAGTTEVSFAEPPTGRPASRATCTTRACGRATESW